METPFRIHVSHERRAIILAPSGELDLASAPELEAELERTWRSEAELVIVDLRRVEFIDSTGLYVIVTADQRADEQGRRFAVVDGGGQVHTLLSLTGMLEIITVVAGPEALLG